MAGTGKRADQNKTRIWHLEYFGKHGFTIPPSIKKHDNPINIENLPDQEKINLQEQGYTKLLAKGTPSRKHHIIVQQCSKKAREKIEKSGGQVELTA